ncbi:MAG: hypothetical protein KA258_04585 [Deltaproteobacteria bacterium]|nr:hypothetical protein [Deltaproteobacteria bacterium]
MARLASLLGDLSAALLDEAAQRGAYGASVPKHYRVIEGLKGRLEAGKVAAVIVDLGVAAGNLPAITA